MNNISALSMMMLSMVSAIHQNTANQVNVLDHDKQRRIMVNFAQLGAGDEPEKYILKFEGDSDAWLTVVIVIIVLIVLCCCICCCCLCCECCPWNKMVREQNQALVDAINKKKEEEKKQEEKKDEEKKEGDAEEKKDE